MNIFFIFISVLFFFSILRNILLWTSLWQIKEYRLDRFLAHIKETTQGRNLFFSPMSILKWAAIFAYLVTVFRGELLFLYQIFVSFVIGLQFFFISKEFLENSFKRPTFTLKAIVIISLSLFVSIVLFFMPLVDRFLWFLLIDKSIFLFVAFFTFSFSFPTDIYIDLKIKKAIEKIKNHKKVLVIGITGSYGKSSTKEYTAQILESKFNVLKTKGTNNTPIGVANTVLSGLKDNIELFVVEMAAYTKGEIKEMCEIVHPKIGILTGVSMQHLSLFGSVQNIMDAKYELIQSLPKDGLAVFNGNNENAYKLYKKTKKPKILYSVSNGNPKLNNSLVASNLNVLKDSVEFDVQLKNKNVHMKAPLIGAHNVENILPGIYLADYLGMSDREIQKAVSGLTSLDKTMTRYQSYGEKATLIDDTFNTSPDAVLAALNYIKIYKGKKIMVLQPMIELGKNAKDEHYRVACEISNVCDYLFLTNNNFYNSIMRGINNKCIVRIESASEIAKFVAENTNFRDVVIFEGKEAARSLSRLL